MGNFVFNIAKGRVAEFYDRVDQADPADCALVAVILAETGLEADSVLGDKDSLADVVSGTTNEATNANYARKTFVAADLAALTPDDTNNRMDLDYPDLNWSPGPAAGDNWKKIVWCYDPDTTGGSDSDLIPLTCHDITVIPDGNEVTLSTSTGVGFRAS